MKKRKKLVIFIIVIIVLIIIGASCASSSDSTKDIETSDGKTASEEVKDEKESSADVTIKEQVLVDKKGIKITAVEYQSDGLMGDSIKLKIENTTDKDYTIGCDALIVNNYMIYDLFSCDVAAGKTANETLDLYNSQLSAAGIDSVGKIEVYFHAFDDNLDDLFSNEYAKIKTSDFENMDTKPNDAGKELYNKNGVRIVGKTVDEDSFWGSSILLYMENKSGKNIGIMVEDMSVNGTMVDPAFSATVYNKKKSIDAITLFSSDLEENEIESIDEVELKFSIYDEETYETIDESDVITFKTKSEK